MKFAEKLAPLEERRKTAAAQTKDGTGRDGEPGAIVIDQTSVNLPQGMDNERETKAGIEPVVLIILGLLLAYIGFITWQISQMPPN